MKITPEIVLRAYASGIFPMAKDRNAKNLFWVDPEWRGIFPLNAVHVPRRLAKKIRQNRFSIKFNRDFKQVIVACAKPAPGRESTWINDEIIAVYCSLYQKGYAHSVEAWQGEKLVGGLYGVSLRGAFFGESMFSNVTDSSKITLLYLIHHLKKSGCPLLDVQFLTEHLARLGAIEVHRTKYHKLLKRAMVCKHYFYLPSTELDGNTVLQSITQTS